MLRHHRGHLERVRHVAAVGLRHHQGGLEHDVVEARALERLGEIDIELAGPRLTARGERRVPLVDREIGEPGEVEAWWRHARVSRVRTWATRCKSRSSSIL